GRYHNPTARARRPDGHLEAVVKGAHEWTFRTAELLVWGQMQADLDLRLVKHPIVFAAHHIGEGGEIGKDGSGAILPIQTEEDSLWWELMGLHVGLDRPCRAPQFCPVLAVPRVAE